MLKSYHYSKLKIAMRLFILFLFSMTVHAEPSYPLAYSSAQSVQTMPDQDCQPSELGQLFSGIAGAVVGGLIGNQIGGGLGRRIAVVAGSAGGAYVGRKIYNQAKKSSCQSIQQ